MLEALQAMGSVVLDPYLVLLILMTTILGVVIGVLPGLGATTGAALEACVKRELGDLGFGDARVYSPGRVMFSGGPCAIARANLWLRTADRVLLVVGSFEARDFGELFDRTYALPWERWISADGEFPVQGRSYKSSIQMNILTGI